MTSLTERGYYASEAPLIERERPAILNSWTIDFSKHSDFFMKAFQSDPDATFLTYNPSAAFINPPDSYRAVRVDSGDRTKSIIFKSTDAGLEPYPDRTFDLEDPFASNIDGKIVFGGVQVDKSRDSNGEIVSNWRTILFRGETIPQLEPFFTGPDGMKDIRLVKRPNKKIGVYTRPRSPGNESLGGDGQIGYTEFESLDQLEEAGPTSLNIHNAPLLSFFRFPKGQWGGVNHVQVVKDGTYKNWNLLLIHSAYRDTARHYSAGALLHDPQTERIVDLGTLVKRSDLPPGPWKGQEESEDLRDVFFGTELILLDRNRAKIIGGVSDAETGEAEILNPLLQLAA
jgi:hypothetical protein